MFRYILTALIPCAVLASAASAVSIATVPVGNQANSVDSSTGCGQVNYAYSMGKYEVTAGQYCEFLNAVAATDTYYLYESSMNSGEHACRIARTGQPGSYVYQIDPGSQGTASDWADRPVNYISWGAAARFANWLHNGQPTGAQDLSTTEDGAYFLNGALDSAALLAVSREPDAKWAIPTEDEWYKAAYHKDNGNTGDYFTYPTSSDSEPDNTLAEPVDPGNNATYYDGGYTIYTPYYRTEMGAHENSESPYGTYDQGGNIYEWNEEIFYDSYRGMRGGSYQHGSNNMLASVTSFSNPSAANNTFGFRVVCLLSSTPGDTDLDGDVDLADFNTLKSNFQTGTTWAQGDFDDNGNVDLTDFNLLKANFTGASPIPEPATIMLLATGALALFRHRGTV